MGAEISLGVLALRIGYRRIDVGSELTVGTGLMLGNSSFDYSVGVAEEIDATHRISYAFRFGAPASMVGSPEIARVRVPRAAHPPVAKKVRRVPEAQEEDTEEVAYVPAPKKQTLGSLYKAAPSKRGFVAEQPKQVYRTDTVASVRRTARTYTVRPGDTLASIARDVYGNPKLWQALYRVNKHLLKDPRDLEVGQKIVLP